MGFAEVAVRMMDDLGYDRYKRTAKSEKVFDAIMFEVEGAAYELARTSAGNKVAAPIARMVPMYEAFVAEGLAKKTPVTRHFKSPEVPGFEFVYYRGPKMTGKALHFTMQSKEAEDAAYLLAQMRAHSPNGFNAALKRAQGLKATKSAKGTKGARSSSSKR